MLCLSACQPAGRSLEPSGAAPARAYSAEEAALFDDSIAPEIIDPAPWQPDTKLEDRLARAEHVVIARIATITESRASTQEPLLSVALRVEQALLGPPPAPQIEILLHSDNPAYALLRWRRSELSGRRLILLFCTYQEGGLKQVHFRAEPNVPEVISHLRQVPR